MTEEKVKHQQLVYSILQIHNFQYVCIIISSYLFSDIRETSKAVNYSLMKLITNFNETNVTPENLIGIKTPDKPPPDSNKNSPKDEKPVPAIDLNSVVDVLTRNLQNTAVPTKVAVLRWIYHLHLKMGNQMFRFVDETFPVLLKTLSDPSDEVVLLSLEVLAEIVSFPCKNPNRMILCNSLGIDI